MSTSFTLNGATVSLDAAPTMPLLWAVRELAGLHGTKFGTKNVAWDNEFMDRLESEPAPLAELSTQDYMERGGTEGVEMIMWLAMRGALGKNVKRVHRSYTAPLTTGYGLLVLET